MSRRSFLRKWVPPVVLGESAGFAVAAMVAVVATAILSDRWVLPAVIAGGICEGVLLGLGQWLELRRHLSHATWWIVINAVSWIVGVAWTIGPSPFIDASTPVPVLVLAYVVAGVLMATTVAIITGLATYRAGVGTFVR